MRVESRLWRLTEGVRARIAAAVAIGVLASFVGVLRFALLGWLIAKVFAGAPPAELAAPIAGVAVVMILRGVLEHWRTMIAHATAARVQHRLRMRLYEKVVELGPAWLGLERTGGVTLSMIDGVEQLETWFGRYLPQLFVAAITPFAIFAFVAWLDLPVAATMLGFALFTLAAPAAFQRWDAANSMRRSRAYRAFAAEFLDAVQGLATLKAFGQGAARGRMLAERAHEVFRTTMWVLATNALTRGITDTGLALGTAAVLALGAWRVTHGVMSVEVLLAILMMGIEVYRPQRDLRALLHDGMMGRAAADGIFAVLDADPVVKPLGTEVPLGDGAEPRIEFEGVRFAYPGGRRAAHDGLSFHVAPGERVGFVGASGAGKSTIVKLLLRFYDPDIGTVRVGGRDLRGVVPSDVYDRVAVVHQDTYLFHGTVEENLRLGRHDATHDDLVRAARDANAHEFIERLPQGYATVVGERGIRLSGGQRQRIAIARALLRDAPILVLDEALSAVDAENEAVIQQALDRLMEGRTTLVFAHRLSSVVGADRILALEDGRVVESGTHVELMRARGVYHRLMASQASEGVTDTVFDAGAAARAPLGRDERADAIGHAQHEPTDAILRADGMGWIDVVRELMRHAAPWKAKLVAVFVLGVARVIALIGIGVMGALLVAAVRAGDPYSGILTALLVMAPLAGVLHWFESWLAHDMAFRMLAQMRIDLFEKLERLAPAYLVRRRSGDLVAMATHDVELVEYFFAHTVAPALVAVLVPAAVIGTLLTFGWPTALALAPFLAVMAVSPFVLRRRIDVLGSRAREALGDLNAHAVDTLQGLPEIAAFRHAERRAAQFAERIRTHFALRMPFYRDLSIQTSLLEVVTGLGGLAVVATGAHLVAAGRLDAAVLPMLTLLAMAAFLPISEIAHIGRQLADTLGATRRLYAVHHERETVRDGAGVPRPAPGRPVSLALDGVAFSYFGDARLALRDVSFEIPAGSTVALVGPSGAGKTTVAHLLMRFWDPARGRVTIDRRDLREHRLDDLRDAIALVTQDTYLFNDSLRANIALARPQADGAALDEAIERAALTEFVDALPEGLETRVGERGVRLSGGQRQRVAIARAFLKDAPVLVLDEATSHLDAVNEQAVRRALEALMSHRTTLVIAHRLSTVRDADRIVVIDGGRSVEQGTHSELLARGGLYRQLVGHQIAGTVAAAGR